MTWIYTYYAQYSSSIYLDSVAALALNPNNDTLVAYLTRYEWTLDGSRYRCFFKVDPSTGVIIGNSVCPDLGEFSLFNLGRSLNMDNYGQVYAGFYLH